MGYCNSSYVAQRASEMCYSNDTMIMFTTQKGWVLGSADWPFTDTSEFLVLYLDDLCLFSSRSIPNAVQVHLNLNEFCLWATQYWGFKIGKSKFFPFVIQCKFLGHYFDVEQAAVSIPPEKIKAILQFRAPSSQAETNSRLGILGYFRKYVPMLKVLMVPL